VRAAAAGGVGIAVAAALGAGAFSLLRTLDRPSFGDRLATSLIVRLDHDPGSASLLRLPEGRFASVCRQLSRSSALVSFGAGGEARIVGTHVVPTDLDRLRGTGLVAATDVAGCPRLLATELSIQLRHRGGVVATPTRYDGIAAYRLVVRRRPLFEVTVARSDLRPLSARFVSSSRTATSELRPVRAERPARRQVARAAPAGSRPGARSA